MNSAEKGGLDSKVRRWIDGDPRKDNVALIRHLALRRDPDAATELARLNVDPRPASISLSAAAMARRATARNHPQASYNLAVDHFNNRDLDGYRYWLRRAARAGDSDALRQLTRFEKRLPHGLARNIGRQRPYRADD